MFTGVEHAGGVVIQEVLLEFLPVGFCGWEWWEVGIGGGFVGFVHWHSCCGIWGAKWVIMPLLCASLLYNINRGPIYK